MHISTLIAGAYLVFVATAQAASFDCRRAQHSVEKIVCTDGALSKLDDELAAVWKTSQATCGDPTKMRLHEQQAWMAEVRREAMYYTHDDQSRSRADAEKAQTDSLRDGYRRRIEALLEQTEECKWRASEKPQAALLVPESPLDCKSPADALEKALCQRDDIRNPFARVHAAFASAVAACADSRVRWRHPLAAVLDELKRAAQANEQRQGERYRLENEDFGNIHSQLGRADEPWNELNVYCQDNPVAERLGEMRVTDASKQLDFTIKQTSYLAGDKGAHLIVKNAKTKATLLALDLPSIMLNMEGGSLLVNSARLYDTQGTINVGDFNFDGLDDFAVQIGQEGSYGGPNYAVFLRTANGFVHNQRMSELTIEGLGFFDFDAKTRTLSTFSKSGCCDHWGTQYKVVNNQVVPIRMTRDALSPDGMGRIEESVFTRGRWKTTKVQAYRPPEYCEEPLTSAGEVVLQGHRASNYLYSPLCSLLSASGRVGVWLTLMPTLKPGETKWGGGKSLQGDWGVYMAIANTREDGLLAQYANPTQFKNTYASSEATTLDAKTFIHIGLDPVWALMQGLQGQGIDQNGTSPRQDELNLFRWNRKAKRIDNILAGLVTRTEEGNIVTLRKLLPLTTKHNGMKDLALEEFRFPKQSKPGPLPKDVNKQRWVLHFDGERYPLPIAVAKAR